MRIDAMASFLKLVETGSYAAAAEALYTGTSTVHSQVKSIEMALNAELVVFNGRTLQLTHAGTRFLVFAEQTFAEFQRLRDELSGKHEAPTASLKVVALPSMAAHMLPPAVRNFASARGDVRVLIDGRRIGEAIAALVSRNADIAILLEPHVAFAQDVFQVARITTTNSVFVVRDCEQANQMDPLDLIRSWPISAQPPSSISRQYLERWSREHGISLNVRYEHSLMDGILSDVSGGNCVGVVTNHFGEIGGMQGLVVLDVPDFIVNHEVVAVYSPYAGPVARDFVDFLREYCDRAREQRPAPRSTHS